MKENQKKYTIKKLCEILEISRSGYYEYLHWRKSKKSVENEALSEIISDIFKKNEGTGHVVFRKCCCSATLELMKNESPPL